MTTQLSPPHQAPDQMTGPRRPAWRQRLVEAERGMTQGMRSDSTFFVHFFISSIVIATAAVLGIGFVEWLVLILSLTLVLSAEMFNQVLKIVLEGVRHHFPETTRKGLRVGTAAVFVTMVGSTTSVLLILGRRLVQMFAG